MRQCEGLIRYQENYCQLLREYTKLGGRTAKIPPRAIGMNGGGHEEILAYERCSDHGTWRHGDGRGSGPKAPPPPPCTACNWSGFYLGVNAGGSFGHDPSNDAISLIPPGGIAGVTNPISNTSYSQSPSGALGGFQAGFNWQTGHAVLGAEVDWDAANQRSRLQVNNFLASSVSGVRP